MRIEGKCVVVTGAASGIGAALARRFAAEGARGVVVADVQTSALEAVARRERQRPRGRSATSPTRRRSATLVDRAEDRFGPIDLFCSNAGIVVPGGAGRERRDLAPQHRRERDGARVRGADHGAAHDRAGRRLPPADRVGGGAAHARSAARRTRSPSTRRWRSRNGSRSRTASKGIKVSVLAPQAVRTAMTMGIPDGGVAGVDGMLEPDTVADAVVRGLAIESFLILPHPAGAGVLPAQGLGLRPLDRGYAAPASTLRRFVLASRHDRTPGVGRRSACADGHGTRRTSDDDVDAAIAAVDDVIDEARAELEALVRIPSISADPKHYADVHASADATVELLRGHGLENVRTAGVEGSQPFVIGEWMHAGPRRADRSAVRASRRAAARHRRELGERSVRARGARTAGSTGVAPPTTRPARSRTRTRSAPGSTSAGTLPCNVRVLVEGEEEIGSPTLHAFLTAHLEELRSDVLVLADAGNWQVGVPGLTYSLRGLAAADIELRALDGPQHSGMSGGAIPDPVMALSRVLASLVDEHGDVAFAGGFDGLSEPAPKERADRGFRRRARALRASASGSARASS